MAIIKLNYSFCDHCIFRRGCFKNKVPENSAKAETTIGIFTMMMNVEAVQVGENFL